MTLPRAFLFSTLTLSVAATLACEGSTRQSTSALSPSGDASTADGAAGAKAGNGGGSSSTGGSTNGAGAANGAGATNGAGGSGGAGNSGGDTGSGGSGPFVPPKCANPNQQLPADAPVLTPGVWTPINGQIPFRKTPAVVTQGMAIDPCNAATLYVCVGENPLTGNGGLWRSINAGTSWTKIGPMDGPNNVRVDPKNPLHIYATDGVNGKTRGFWSTTDGGKTWTLPDGFQTVSDAVHNNDDVYRVEPDPADFNHLLLSFHSYWNNGDTAGVFESFDGGQKFTAIPVPDVHGGAGYDVFFLFNPILGMGDNKTWLYATQTVGYYRTIDAGKTWKKVSDTSMAHGGGQLYYTKDKVIYMGGDLSLQKSIDNGVNWTQVGPRDGYIGLTGDGTNLYTSPSNVDKPFITSLETDGVTWTAYNTQVSHGGAFEMTYDATNGIVYSANLFDGVMALKVKK